VLFLLLLDAVSAASDTSYSTTSTSGRLNAEALKDYKVLVAGATGGCGRKVVETLVQHNVPVRALVRDLDKAVSCIIAQYRHKDNVTRSTLAFWLNQGTIWIMANSPACKPPVDSSTTPRQLQPLL
jgi:hypothetical protein